MYGPRSDNWYKRLNANWNILVDLEALIPFAWRLKVGGALFDSHSSNYSQPDLYLHTITTQAQWMEFKLAGT
ncbi:MAG: hypothetical protein Ct9H300mP18_07960 [Candidatus Neomarinimicrobiota bacterium]|nr:MAG: hypothetical protein Ct9H300mP18_07960 [Candidatus Neomarinimicrobiota bacterium]